MPSAAELSQATDRHPVLVKHGGPPSLIPLARAAALPAVLLEGEDDPLVDVAAFQLAVGLGGLPHGHGFVGAQAEPALG